MPADILVTTPILELIVAMPGDTLLQSPPSVASLNVIVAPTHNDVGPVTTSGVARTNKSIVAMQPELSEYEIVVVPAAIHVTSPVVEFIAATVGCVLTHVPPVTASVSVNVEPTQANVGPEMAGGPLTVTIAVT